MQSDARYAYVTLAIVAVVALLAVWLILGTSGLFPFTSKDRNTAGAAFNDPTQHTVTEGDFITVVYQGVDYEVVGMAAVAPDHTGKASAFLTVNGEWSGRLYVDNPHGFSGNIVVQVVAVQGDTITFLIWRPSTPLPGLPPVPQDTISETLIGNEIRTYTFPVLGDVRVAVNPATADQFAGNRLATTFLLNDVTTRPLHVGETDVVAQAAITLRDLAIRHDGKTVAAFYLTPAATAQNTCGARDEQTASCTGQFACCGGACQALPTCGRRLDGPVDSCLDRQLYCCTGELSFIACGVTPGPTCGNGICETGEADQCPIVGDGMCTQGTCQADCESDVPPVEIPPAQTCTRTSDCTVTACVQAPCPTNVCVSGTCQERYLTDRGGKSCTTVDECPAFACITAPCDIPLCEQGRCVLASTTPPSGGVNA